ncbi:hypothetical protein AAFF_G00436750 [Aldrovandia affinis]|uniref:Uncharacterized protein n=1 Tax=Aldrovandia affinis TaxID=143900 RepID=A0AAD7WHX4_9TELE|nr:hypothetical protein AAFF_G00436750 [Aldrovandia affinis]
MTCHTDSHPAPRLLASSLARELRSAPVGTLSVFNQWRSPGGSGELFKGAALPCSREGAGPAQAPHEHRALAGRSSTADSSKGVRRPRLPTPHFRADVTEHGESSPPRRGRERAQKYTPLSNS